MALPAEEQDALMALSLKRGTSAMVNEQRREEDRLVCAFLEWLLPKSSGDRLATSHRQEEGRKCRFDDFWALFRADGSLEWPDFERFVRWESKLAGNARKLFDLLDDTGSGRISARTVLQARREFERSTDVRHSNLDDLKRLLVHLHGNLGRAWRKNFVQEQTGKQQTGKCCQSVFVKACRAVGFQGDLRSTWAELTHGEIHRQATLADLDPDVDQLFRSFVLALKKWHHTARDGWFAIIKADGSHGRMSLKDFQAVGARFGFSERETKKLFNCLDVNLDRRVSLSEWLFLELFENGTETDSFPSNSRPPSAETSSARRPQGTPRGAEPGGNVNATRHHASRAALVPGEAGEPESVAEFVVVLSKEEYNEYQKRLRKRYGRSFRGSNASSRNSTMSRRGRTFGTASSIFNMEAWAGLALDSSGTGLEAT